MATVEEHKSSLSHLCHEYIASWKVNNLERLGPKSLKIPAFSPIPNSDATFYFELWYQKKRDSDNDSDSIFKMILVKSCGLNTPLPINMNINVTVNDYNSPNNYNSPALFKYDYKDINFEKMDVINFPSEVFQNARGRGISIQKDVFQHARDREYNMICLSDNNRDLPSRTFVIKCQFVFYNHLNSPTEYFQNERKLKNLKNFANDFNAIYKPIILSDIEFKIGNESLRAHKSVLAAHSPVFLRMISDNFLESVTNTIAINDASPEVFKLFLKYLYSGEIEEKTWDIVNELFALADKYDIRTLKSDCGEIIASFISTENVCETLRMAYNYNEDFLKREAKTFAYQHIGELLSKDDWRALMKSNPLIGYEVMLNFATPKFPPEECDSSTEDCS